MIPVALLFLALGPADWVPMRWISTDPQSLELLDGSSINCLVVDPSTLSKEFRESTRARKIDLIVIGAASERTKAEQAGLTFLEETDRGRMKIGSSDPVLVSRQAVWPGINLAEGEAEAMPSGAPWIDTNAGFFRFARAFTGSRIWVSSSPPPNRIIPVSRYIQAIADAAFVGGSWVLTLDPVFSQKLLSRDPKALADWKQINTVLRFYAEHREWSNYSPAGQMAVIQGVHNGGLLSGGVLDMVSSRHTPIRAVPAEHLTPQSMQGIRMAVNTSPASLSAEQKTVLKQFQASGGSLFSAPEDWMMPEPRADQVTLDKSDITSLDKIWKEVTSMTNRQNLGARLFNVASMLSNLTTSPDGKSYILHLVNFSDYPIEDITVHLHGKVNSGRLFTPEAPDQPVELFEVDEGSGAEISKIISIGAVVFERQ